ncbi:unnamed protein product [Gongylonema pulchrum]|uniref:Peptidylprolyl isomerase n=1 Tax=Gongylonema pulchrum TaxID=637853 RepID=A0A183D3Q5_9BILA|nr:unnamed protein product [Gongylonema pulchrum]
MQLLQHPVLLVLNCDANAPAVEHFFAITAKVPGMPVKHVMRHEGNVVKRIDVPCHKFLLHKKIPLKVCIFLEKSVDSLISSLKAMHVFPSSLPAVFTWTSRF